MYFLRTQHKGKHFYANHAREYKNRLGGIGSAATNFEFLMTNQTLFARVLNKEEHYLCLTHLSTELVQIAAIGPKDVVNLIHCTLNDTRNAGVYERRN